jgi:hypothetical protein
MLGSIDAAAADVVIVVVDGATTVRRTPIPHAEEGRGGQAPALTNGSFTDGLAGWSASETNGSAQPGGVVAQGEAAVLREGDSFLVTLSQEFQLPPEVNRISFTIRFEPGFDSSDTSIPDAFEVSLLDSGQLPVTASWSHHATSFLNFQENGTVNAGPGVTWDGQRATLDLPAPPAGQDVTIFFDLIGADADTGGAVIVDDVEATILKKEGFLRGNPNLDQTINITDPIVILNYLFLGTSQLHCLDAADTNNDGVLNITDPIYLLGFLFLGTAPIPPPFEACGPDEGPEDGLDCGPCSCPGSTGGGDCP